MVTNVTNLSRSGLYDWMAQRVSAVVLAAYFIFLIGYLVANPGLGFMLYALGKSLGSEEGFADVKACLTSPLAKFVAWGLLSALLYHLVAGVRHLIMDMGIGETLEGGRLGSKIIIAVSVVLIVLAGVWIW